MDLTLDYNDISVYTFTEDKSTNNGVFQIENVSGGEKNVLELIGARTSSVFLSNCTIWVEGITDRLYLRKYFDVFQADKNVKFKEDLHFSFVEYGGNNITHWSFLDSQDEEHSNINVERLCSKLFLVTDNDGAGLTKDGKPNTNKPAKFARHQKLTEKLSERYYCLSTREIENSLSKEVIKETVIEYEGINASNLDFSAFNKKHHE